MSIARALVILCALLHGSALAGPGDWLRWDDLLPLPKEADGEGAVVGVSGDFLIVAGGIARSPDGSSAYRDAIFTLNLSENSGQTSWRHAGHLPFPLAHGASVSTTRGLLCLGGVGEDGPLDRVIELVCDSLTGEVRVVEELAHLPVAVERPAATRVGNRVYVMLEHATDGETSDGLRVLDLPPSGGSALATQWRRAASPPGPARTDASLVVQSTGDQDAIYYFGGATDGVARLDGWRYDISDGRWVQLADMPGARSHAAAVAAGNSHVLVFGNSKSGNDVLAYNTITNQWSVAGRPPEMTARGVAARWSDGWVMVCEPIGRGSGESSVHVGRSIDSRRGFGGIDMAVLVIYLLSLVGIGWYFSRRGKTTEDYFLGGRRIPWWAAGLSIMATQVSSIGFMAVPAKSFATNWLYFAGVATWFLVVPIATLVFIPFFRRINITSAYEYLERRFNIGVRMIAASIFCVMQLARIAIVLYLPALALSAVIGFDLWLCVLLMGLLATLYTVAGGMEAVVWTDVVQAVVLFGGALLVIGFVMFGIEGGPAQFFDVATTDQKLTLADLRWDYTMPVLWVVLVGNAATRVSDLTADQSIIQRYLSTPDASQAKRALWINVAVSIPWALLVFGLGTALYVFYKLHPEQMDPGADVNGIVPLFIAQQVPTGLSGLIVAGIFAAAMSSFDSSVHSVATVATTDFYQRFRTESSGAATLWLARCVTAALGVLGTISAMAVASSGVRSIWDLFMEMLGLGLGVLAGFFLLGAFSKRGSALGAIAGAVASVVILYVVKYHTRTSFFLYPAIGIASSWGIGYLVSVVLPPRLTAASIAEPATGS